MCIENLAEVTLAPGLPVRGGLHVQAHVRELRCEGCPDQHRVLIGIREELFGEAILVVSAVDGECRDAGSEPRDAVLTVAGVIDRRRAARSAAEPQLVNRATIDGGAEPLPRMPPPPRSPP